MLYQQLSKLHFKYCINLNLNHLSNLVNNLDFPLVSNDTVSEMALVCSNL